MDTYFPISWLFQYWHQSRWFTQALTVSVLTPVQMAYPSPDCFSIDTSPDGFPKPWLFQYWHQSRWFTQALTVSVLTSVQMFSQALTVSVLTSVQMVFPSPDCFSIDISPDGLPKPWLFTMMTHYRIYLLPIRTVQYWHDILSCIDAQNLIIK